MVTELSCRWQPLGRAAAPWRIVLFHRVPQWLLRTCEDICRAPSLCWVQGGSPGPRGSSWCHRPPQHSRRGACPQSTGRATGTRMWPREASLGTEGHWSVRSVWRGAEPAWGLRRGCLLRTGQGSCPRGRLGLPFPHQASLPSWDLAPWSARGLSAALRTELGGRETRLPGRGAPQAAPGRLATGRLTCLAEVEFDTVHRLKCLFLCFSFH